MSPRRLAIIVFALALLTGGVVFGVEGSGGGPEVLSQDAQVRFAEGVTFNVEVKAESPVVEVKLNFRNANDGPWNYVYLEVEPGTRIEAEHLLETDGATYIPPLASLEYFYTVRDEAGNVSETPRQSLLYTDTRFEWESVTAGPLVLLYHDLSRNRVERFAESLVESLAWVEEVLGGGPEKPMLGVIYNRESEVREAFPRLSRTIDEEQIFHGFAFSEWNLFAGIGLKEGLIVHEAAHLMLDAVIHDPSPPIPAWLNEGFASYAEPGSRARPASRLENRREGTIPLRGMQSMTGRMSDISYFYRKSESVVTHLIEGTERRSSGSCCGNSGTGCPSTTRCWRPTGSTRTGWSGSGGRLPATFRRMSRQMVGVKASRERHPTLRLRRVEHRAMGRWFRREGPTSCSCVWTAFC